MTSSQQSQPDSKDKLINKIFKLCINLKNKMTLMISQQSQPDSEDKLKKAISKNNFKIIFLFEKIK